MSTWRLIDLCQIVQERFGVSYSETGMGKLMRSLDLSWQTPRSRHAETDRAAQERFKKGALCKPSRRSRPTTPRLSGSRSGSQIGIPGRLGLESTPQPCP
ncbi:helix-turn-helix domain-containing protein [Paeniroseomonas aquatica]|uniref:helix-turn-helix domain-containing protein n=1 Tax=Paeniroseomonas aquatica TaxID=373043 RepID=UPI00338E33DC